MLLFSKIRKHFHRSCQRHAPAVLNCSFNIYRRVRIQNTCEIFHLNWTLWTPRFRIGVNKLLVGRSQADKVINAQHPPEAHPQHDCCLCGSKEAWSPCASFTLRNVNLGVREGKGVCSPSTGQFTHIVAASMPETRLWTNNHAKSSRKKNGAFPNHQLGRVEEVRPTTSAALLVPWLSDGGSVVVWIQLVTSAFLVLSEESQAEPGQYLLMLQDAGVF